MRKIPEVLLASALLVPGGAMTSPAGAVSGTTCKTANGSATFKPALPKLGVTNKVLSTVSVTNGKVGGCAGGGVTSGALKLSAKFSKPGNCATLASAGSSNPAKGTETITWNNAATSTVALSLIGVNGQPTQAKIVGTVTAGLFKGAKQSGTIGYSVPNGACTKKALSTVMFKQLTAQIIR